MSRLTLAGAFFDMNWFTKIRCTTAVAAFCALNLNAAEFVHPGGMFNRADMDRMRYQVEARIDPWHASFLELQAEPLASHSYTVRGDPGWTTVGRDPAIRRNEFESDVTAAYLNSLMWIVTGDERHAAKCVEIFNTWQNLTEVRGGGTESLNAGLYAWKLVEAAEIIRSTYDGWDPQDLKAFQDMLVYPGYSNTEVPPSLSNTNGTFYWRVYRGDPGRHGNQDMIAWRAMITMGVFLDNRIMYDRALRYFTGQPSREDDLPYPSGPSPSGPVVTDNEFFTAFQYRGSANRIPDYGYNGVLEHFIWETGQTQESSRDQAHAMFGLGTAAGIAEVAWTQGDDVWNSLENRLLKGFEFNARYNASYIAAFPDQPDPWEPDDFIQRTDRTGRWFSKKINPHFESNFVSISRGNFPGVRPIFEQALAHFDVRMGQGGEAVWTRRARDVAIAQSGYERTGWSLDHPGWGALTFRRPPLTAGDPIQGFTDGVPEFGVHRFPTTIAAVNYDYFPGSGLGRTYLDHTPENRGGHYRPNDAVDIEYDPVEGDYLTDMEAGEWLTYTVSVPADGWYRFGVRYSTANDQGAIRFSFGGADVTGAVALPDTGGPTEWEDLIVADSVFLGAGVQAMRVHVAGESHSFRLASLTVQEGELPVDPPPAPAELSATAVSSGEIRLEWSATPATATYNVKRATVSGGPYATVASGVSGLKYSDSGLTANTTYFYVVSAENNVGESDPSAEVSATTPDIFEGAWSVDADGNWSDSGNWLDGIVADGAGVTADFSRTAISDNRIVVLDTSRTIGHLVFGAGGSGNSWAIASAPEASLRLEAPEEIPSIQVNESMLLIEPVISGSQGLRKTGEGVLVLSNKNHEFDGGLTVDEGYFRVGGSGTLGGGEIRVNAGGTLDLAPSLQISDRSLSIAGSGAGGEAGAFYLDATGLGNQTRWGLSGINPAIRLLADATIRVDGDGFGPNTANFLVGRTDLGGNTLTKTGSGRLSFDTGGNGLQGAGTVHVAEGVLGFRGGAFAGNRNLVIDSGAEARVGGDNNALNSTANLVTVDGTLNLNARGNGNAGSDNLSFSQTIGRLAGSGTITTGVQGSTGTQTLTVSHSGPNDSVFEGTITQANGAVSLVKSGSNTLVLNGTTAHRGNTTVNAGRLVIGETGQFTFHIGSSGQSNRVLGNAEVEFNGAFYFNLDDAGSSEGDSWAVVDVANLSVAFGPAFQVGAFVETDAGLWRRNAKGVGYEFDQSTGRLQVFELFEEDELQPKRNPFEKWQFSHFGDGSEDPALAGPYADPDGDGILNLLEFALGGNPLVNSRQRVPRVGQVDGYLVMTFWRVRAAETFLQYRVEAANDKSGPWTEIWSSIDHPYSTNDDMIEESVTDFQPIAESPTRFLRLVVFGE